jgi:hypothetical protein
MECDKTEARAISLIAHVPQFSEHAPMSSATTEPAKKSQSRSKPKEKHQGQSKANGTERLKTTVPRLPANLTWVTDDTVIPKVGRSFILVKSRRCECQRKKKIAVVLWHLRYRSEG